MPQVGDWIKHIGWENDYKVARVQGERVWVESNVDPNNHVSYVWKPANYRITRRVPRRGFAKFIREHGL